MNRCSRVELSRIAKIKIILITLRHINLKILGVIYCRRHQAGFALMHVKVIINPIMQDAKLEQSETMALPPIHVERTDRLSTGLHIH